MHQLEKLDRGILVRIAGDVAGRDVLEANRSLMQEAPMEHHEFSIWDYRDLKVLDFTVDQVRILADMDSSYARRYPGRKIAVLAGSAMIYGLGRMYEQYFGDGPWEIRIFREWETSTAFRWVGLSA